MVPDKHAPTVTEEVNATGANADAPPPSLYKSPVDEGFSWGAERNH